MAQQRLKEKDIDLLRVYKVKKQTSATPIMKMMIFPIVSAVVIGSIFGFYSFKNHSTQNKIDKVITEKDKVEAENAQNSGLEKLQEMTKNRSTISKYQTYYDDIMSYPSLSQHTFDQIVIAAGVDVGVTSFSYTRDSQVITLQIETPTASDTENFVRRLKALNEFADVNYSGYSYSKITTASTTSTDSTTTDSKAETTTRSVYVATVLCTLK